MEQHLYSSAVLPICTRNTSKFTPMPERQKTQTDIIHTLASYADERANFLEQDRGRPQ